MHDEVGPAERPRSVLYMRLASGVITYVVTTTIVLVGISAGISLLAPSTYSSCPRLVPSSDNKYVDTLTLWDGEWYLAIATDGYSYDPTGESNVAFFPVYPALVEILHRITRLPIRLAGLFVSHAFLVGALGLLMIYSESRAANTRPGLVPYVVLACVLFPTSFFMRMAYTESLFLFTSLLVFIGLARKWPLPVIAVIVGTATGIRSVGVALLLPFAHHIWEQSRSWRQASVRLVCVTPLALWGLLDYIAFQWWSFGEPFAFARTQRFWSLRPPVEFAEFCSALVSCEPIWSVYVPGKPGYWGAFDRGLPVFLSYQAANPALFVLAIVLVCIGAAKRWLSGRELVFAAALLAIPYVMVGFRFCMASQGRFISVVFPIYIVLGHLLCRMPTLLAVATLALSGIYLAVFCAMLAAGYFIV